jgi:broad specificity phosphatase PhoE
VRKINIYLVRHGQTDHNKGLKLQGVTESELNENGLNQAVLVAERIAGYSIQRIYSSDYKRAVQTAEILHKYTGAEVVVNPYLREIDMGEWEDADWDRIKRLHPQYYSEWSKHLIDMPYPGGESGGDVLKRMDNFITELKSLDYNDVAIVTHGGVIKVFLSALLGMGQEKRFRFNIDNCSFNLVKFNRTTEEFQVHCINDTSHLRLA